MSSGGDSYRTRVTRDGGGTHSIIFTTPNRSLTSLYLRINADVTTAGTEYTVDNFVVHKYTDPIETVQFTTDFSSAVKSGVNVSSDGIVFQPNSGSNGLSVSGTTDKRLLVTNTSADESKVRAELELEGGHQYVLRYEVGQDIAEKRVLLDLSYRVGTTWNLSETRGLFTTGSGVQMVNFFLPSDANAVRVSLARSAGSNAYDGVGTPYTIDNFGITKLEVSATRTTTICEDVEEDGQIVLGGYRFGFNNMEKINEIAGIGNHIDFKFRGYDPRTGRFWSVDPLAQSYPWNSTYAFAENDVIRCIDLEGLEKVDVVTTSFAPFSLFGADGFGAFTGDGAGRKFGLELNKYRTSGSVKLDLANSKYVSKWAATNVTSTYHRYSNRIFDDYTAKSPSRTKVNGLNLQSNFVGTNFSVAGSNKAHMSAPDIDVNVAIGFQRINDTKYRVSGAVRGDRFPANETYLRDEGGNILMLGVSGVNTENENLGPYIDLPGDNRRFMSSFDFNVIFEGENNSTIKGVEIGDGKFIDRETWNQQFQQLDPKSSKTGTSSN